MPKNSNRARRRFDRERKIRARSDRGEFVRCVHRKYIDGRLSKSKATPPYGKRWPREKRWKLLYLRRNKLRRAKKLGFEYPEQKWKDHLDLDISVTDKANSL
ncbi:MAG: hypothetical protein ACRBBN_05815 [Methyloligellaceae bacterium]